MKPLLRSNQWFVGDSEPALMHRASLRAIGIHVTGEKPVIGIANSSGDVNPCNATLDSLADAASKGVIRAGGTPLVFHTMTLGEELMKPTAMLYRNLMAIEVEETIRSYPLDGVVLLANCDKTVPAQLMGAASADVPTILITGGPKPPAKFRGRELASGSDLWRYADMRRQGQLSDEEWGALEGCFGCRAGSCNTMGTASSMACLAEAMGVSLPGTAAIPSGDSRRLFAAEASGERIVQMVHEGLTSQRILTAEALDNALAALAAIGGSTNAVLHVAALAGRLSLPLTLEHVDAILRRTPTVVDLQPSGRYLMGEFFEDGGMPTVLHSISRQLHLDAMTVTGRSLRAEIGRRPVVLPRRSIRAAAQPLHPGGALRLVKGSLAPDGAIVKASAASPALHKHRGPAVVFRGYEDMLARIDDPQLPVTRDSVLILHGIGPVGAPGMPEWGMIPIPTKLLAEGVQDMVRISDGRMSGTSFGTVAVHAAPEGAVGGPIGLTKDGDMVSIDLEAGILDLEVPDHELAQRRAAWQPPESPHLRGWPLLYQQHVMQAPDGCDLDFLRASTRAHLAPVGPTVGRS